MTKQSEHLSNAQIENYGIRTPGAGPEAAQRDEHPRVNHQSIDDQSINDQSISDQRVEAHLADCPSCRNSLLEFHRNLFAPTVDSPEAGPSENDTSPSGYSPSDQRSADSKVEGTMPTVSALADSKFANPNDPADPQVRTASTPECPSTEALRELAAGLTPDSLAAKLTRHAATCDHCGPLLRTFTEHFSDDFSAEEQAVLNNLQSASAAWQSDTARQMLHAGGASAAGDASATAASAAQVGSSRTAATVKSDEEPSAGRPVAKASHRKPFFWKWTLVPVTAAMAAAVIICGVVGFGVWYARRDTPEKVEVLLAQASTEPRTMEVRWPGAAHSRLTVSLGPSDSQSPSLLEAKNTIAHALQKNSSNSAWLRLQAQADILEHKPSPAIDVLKHELEANPDSPSIELGLAIAYFVQGQESDETQYSKALKLLDELLLRQPGNTVARFNRAIVREHLHMHKEAADDWNAVLQYETDAGWRTEAEQHLQRLQEKKTPG